MADEPNDDSALQKKVFDRTSTAQLRSDTFNRIANVTEQSGSEQSGFLSLSLLTATRRTRPKKVRTGHFFRYGFLLFHGICLLIDIKPQSHKKKKSVKEGDNTQEEGDNTQKEGDNTQKEGDNTQKEGDNT
jgi:hypothetical protein